MKVEQAIGLYLEYLAGNARPNTIRSFSYTLTRFRDFFLGREMENVGEAEIIGFISSVSNECSPATKTSRVGAVRAFYNFVIDVTEAGFPNPCMRPMIRKVFKCLKFSSPKLLDKDLIDEIIFRTTRDRDRLILELMGRAGMRVGEVLNVRYADINFDSSTISITQPKSGRTGEKVYVPKKLCGKLHSYILGQNITGDDRLSAISYSTAYRMVRRSAKVANALLRPHDLRRHAATQGSRNNVPLEIVSKVILRHANISTTQRYLGAIDPAEASRWIEHLNR